MTPIRTVTALTGLLALCACAASVPTGPNVLVVPGKDKSFAQFQQDDMNCRGYAQQQIGSGNPQQAATSSGLGTAAATTALGTAAGALIGSTSANLGAGAAIGAASGLLLGSVLGVGNAHAAAGSLQHHYDMAYVQCMVANGDQPSPPPPPPAVYYPAPVYAYPAYPSYAY